MTTRSIHTRVAFALVGLTFCGVALADLGPPLDYWTIKETVGSWNCNEGSGSIAHDQSGHGNHGYLYRQTSWTTGCPTSPPYSLLFHGSTDDYVYVPDNPSLDFDDLGPGEGFMIDFWMKMNQMPTEPYATLVVKADQHQGYCTLIHQDGTVQFYIGDGPHLFQLLSNTHVTDMAWHHIVGVWGLDTMHLYVDDMTVPDASMYVGPFAVAGTWKALTFGDFWGDWEQPYDGRLDEISISVITPEPTSLTLLALGALMAAWRRR
jgi:hypothetical protein